MSAGGSIQSMRNILKNNRNLLKGKRKAYFKRELTLVKQKEKSGIGGQIKKVKKANAQLLISIRKRMQKERQVKVTFQILFALVVTSLVAFYGFSFVNQKAVMYKKTQTISTTSSSKVNKARLSYERNMKRGNQNLEQGLYFMAVGNYKKALSINPGDMHAEYGLAQAYNKSCADSKNFCKEAEAFTILLEEKYSVNKNFTKQQEHYAEHKRSGKAQLVINKGVLE